MPTISNQPVPAIILAGGRSSRMGSNKALLPLGGVPMLRHIIDRLSPQVTSVSLNAPPGWAGDFGLPLVADRVAGEAGPIAGIAAGLHHALRQDCGATHILTVPSDSPFFPADLVSRLHAAVSDERDIVIAVSGGQDHPVFGLWPLALSEEMEFFLQTDERRRLRDFFRRHVTREVDFPFLETPAGPIDPFFNVNTPDDFARAQEILEHFHA
ncbi:molybdenum cofactor guanylyltransferase MobA [Rhizobium sp. LjRoot30]|uniref:molybdenum cofactor guanylyltransferase MobA n=1 Tax=Rhizobium sp. LjRoot30 TaxID=3342320 RepID=UPI003ECD8388